MFHELIQTLLHNNQFASGGLLLMVIGSIGAFFRKIPQNCLDWFIRLITLRLVITDEVDGFEWFRVWFGDKLSHKIRHVDLITPVQGGYVTAKFGLAPGTKWVWCRGRLCRITFSRTEQQASSGYGKSKRVESIEVRTLGRNQKFLTDFVEEIKGYSDSLGKGQASLHYLDDGYWYRIPGFLPRPIQSVILPEGEKESLLEDIDRFYASKEWYRKTGIPYHRGYLLSGVPGSGKTSLVTGIASHFGAQLYSLNLNELNDSSLTKAVCKIPAKSMILLEDVDIVAPKSRVVESSEGSALEDKIGVTLVGLLNVLDGLQSPVGSLFFLTTNHKEVLDPALLRPGRIDYTIEFGDATLDQKGELFERLLGTIPLDSEVLAIREAKTMADFQGVLLKRRNLRHQHR